ncbi:unknown protein [Seminavis robusta]|uniref:Uncharacterized protein n=1 Tax=Seminavis robusta TaxID=568900 RepID=A0A9N8DTN7_9STRA|nr:unknown protein [Seminavis robusta]|eukprot:Sro349_g123340.1 n/a (375) ;mRNA; r:1673-2865
MIPTFLVNHFSDQVCVSQSLLLAIVSIAVAISQFVEAVDQARRSTVRQLLITEKAIDDAAEEAQLQLGLCMLAVSNVHQVATWTVEFSQHWMSWLVYAIVFASPMQVLVYSGVIILVGLIDLVTFVTASSELGSAMITFYAVCWNLLQWASEEDRAPAYVPKRFRGTKLYQRWVLIKASAAAAAVRRGAQAIKSVIAEIVQSHERTVQETVRSIPNGDRWDEDDEDGPYTTAANKHAKGSAPSMLWDLDKTNQHHRPTTFQLFMRFLHALKGGAGLGWSEGSPIVAMQLVLLSLSGSFNNSSRDHSYDTDSVLIAIDNCSSRCITNCMQDFIDTPKKVNVSVQGIGGTVMATYKGTVSHALSATVPTALGGRGK